MKVGLQLYYFEWPGSPQNTGSKLVEIAKTADANGFSSLWVMDHFFQLGDGFGPPKITRVEGPMLEGYSTISYLAAVTRYIKVGLMVTGNFYRHPGILVKIITTLDVLSGGRAYLGIGTGWNEREAKGLGVPYPQTRRELVERLEETLQIAKQMWTGKVTPFEGKYYQLAEPLNSPQPLSQPHPPILIGCEHEKKMLRLVAKYADAVNLHIGGPLGDFPPYIREWYFNREERLIRKLEKLKEYCNDIGRSYDDIERTVLATIRLAPDAMTSAEIVKLCQGLAKIGIQQVIFNMPNVHEIVPLKIFGEEIIPIVTEL